MEIRVILMKKGEFIQRKQCNLSLKKKKTYKFNYKVQTKYFHSFLESFSSYGQLYIEQA